MFGVVERREIDLSNLIFGSLYSDFDCVVRCLSDESREET